MNIKKSEMIDTWFILPNGYVLQPICIIGSFLTYKGVDGETSPSHYINEHRFERIAREFPCSFGSYENLQELEDRIKIEGGFEYFFNDYTEEDFINTPIEREVKEYRIACVALAEKFARLKRDENLVS